MTEPQQSNPSISDSNAIPGYNGLRVLYL